MRTLITLLILISSAQITFGQACGKYRINYVGEIVSESINVIKIKLPSTFYLHSNRLEEKKLDFFEIELENDKFNIEIYSHLTSIYSSIERLKAVYQSKREGIPITLISENNGVIEETKTEISWEDIDIKIIDDDGFGTLFQLDLGEIVRE